MSDTELNDLYRCLIAWRRARAEFAEAAVNDPELYEEESQWKAKAVDTTTGELFELIDKLMPEWREVA